MNRRADFYPKPYPVERLKNIDAKSVVAVEGFGLTAHDVIAELTSGRGGYFVQKNDEIRKHYLM